ncbi:PD40 domain-containing protein [Neobacillus dielmonensis]|uniref:PD40 domain-containing protein n=1 Tax=Neobacillus dielmonensis TaxID=1347369 RepID=UPI0005A6FA9E|nr:PD40 domain-containing protein [Neobacillus dielmonensis]
MNFSKEERLSQYIDQLNWQTGELGIQPGDQEWNELIETVQLIKLTNAIEMPTPGFEENVRQRIKQELAARRPKSNVKKRSWKNYFLPLVAAGLVVLSVSLSSLFPNEIAVADQIRAVKEEQLVSLGITKVNDPTLLSDGEIGFEKEERIVVWSPAESFKEYPLDSFQYMRSPSWSPDGKQVAFSGYQTKNAGIWLMDRDGSNVRKLTSPESPDEFYDHPTWSPNGKNLAFAKHSYTMNQPHGHTQIGEEIWTMEIETGKLVKIAAGSEPSWSPDGKTIAFTKTRTSGETMEKEVWLVNSDGSNSRKLTAGMEPSWSPDGQFITYAKDTTTRKKSKTQKAEIVTTFREIWAIHVDSKRESQLTKSQLNEVQLKNMNASSSGLPVDLVVSGQYSDWQPCWSKDGKSIVFVRDTNEEQGDHFSLMKIDLKYE